jgi:hypothetical protein
VQVPALTMNPVTRPLSNPLSEEFKAHALQVLTRHLGPIAKIVVRRAGERSHGKAQFLQQLLDAADGVDRVQLERELHA